MPARLYGWYANGTAKLAVWSSRGLGTPDPVIVDLLTGDVIPAIAMGTGGTFRLDDALARVNSLILIDASVAG